MLSSFVCWSQQVILTEHVYLVNYMRYADDNIDTYYVNESLCNGRTYNLFVEVNKTNCFHRLKISHWWTNHVLWWCLYLENMFPFHYHYPITSPVRSFLPNIITRNESFNRNSPFIVSFLRKKKTRLYVIIKYGNIGSWNSRVFIALGIMIYERLYHALQIW